MAEDSTTEHKAKLKQVLDSFTEEERKTGAANGMTLDEACATRYLVGHGWDVEKVLDKMRSTLQWRQSFGFDKITRGLIRTESETGKFYVSGFDRDGRPIVYLKPARENTKDHDAQLRNLVYGLECAVSRMGPNVTQWVFIIDFAGYSIRNAPPMKTTRATIDILQSHYPERLYKSYLINSPMLFTGTWRVVSPFIDAKTKGKIEFVKLKQDKARQKFLSNFDVDQLESDFGGTKSSTFNIQDYMPSKGGDLEENIVQPLWTCSDAAKASSDPTAKEDTAKDSAPATGSGGGGGGGGDDDNSAKLTEKPVDEAEKPAAAIASS